MKQTGRCTDCNSIISDETGWYCEMDDVSPPKFFCTNCRPSGNGYTLSDLKQLKEEWMVQRMRNDARLMDLVGPDVYFAITGRAHPRPTDGQP